MSLLAKHGNLERLLSPLQPFLLMFKRPVHKSPKKAFIDWKTLLM